jgi:hypothetical protein
MLEEEIGGDGVNVRLVAGADVDCGGDVGETVFYDALKRLHGFFKRRVVICSHVHLEDSMIWNNIRGGCFHT